MYIYFDSDSPSTPVQPVQVVLPLRGGGKNLAKVARPPTRTSQWNSIFRNSECATFSVYWQFQLQVPAVLLGVDWKEGRRQYDSWGRAGKIPRISHSPCLPI